MQLRFPSSLSLIKAALPQDGPQFQAASAQPVLNGPVADTFTPQVRFSGTKKPVLPDVADTLPTREYLDSFEEMPFGAGFNAILSRGGKNAHALAEQGVGAGKILETKAGSVGNFLLGTLEVLYSIAKDVEEMQEERKMLDQDEKQALETLEGILPAEAAHRRLKGEALYRMLYTQHEKLDKQIAEAAKKEPETVSIEQSAVKDSGISMIVEHNGKKKKGALVFSPALKQLLTGFIRQHDSSLDRTLPAFFKYIQQLEGKPGVPQEINEAAVFLRGLNGDISKAVKLGTVMKSLEQNSPEGFRIRLSELWNTDVPVEKRLMNEAQFAATERMIESMERSHPGDPSREVILNQLNTLLYQVPWNKSEEKSYAKADIQKALDDDHYGLQEVKGEIVTYAGRDLHLKKLLAAGIQPKNDGEPTIICLVGPPGVGKTSIGKSIARATGRNFTRVALGGVSDEAEIRGHRSTYIGALPGKIVKGLIQAKSTNSVFMLDEIDKLAASKQGDPAAALLEVLDPEQNNTFTDNFLGVPTDLSQVMFICTANSWEAIPAPLRDRMQKIELSGYTTEEKIQIAQQHLIPKAREGNGLDKATLGFEEEPFNISNDELTRIMEGYAPERGVRTLKKSINIMAAKTASQLSDLPGLPTPKDFPASSPNRLKEMLGRAKYKVDKVDPKPMVGRIHGMYYSDGAKSGGTMGLDVILNEEKLPKRGHPRAGLVLGRVTGNMAKVMTESAERAFDYVKCNAQRLGIKDLDKRRIEVFIGSSDQGDKDGPSAGTALTLALISALTKRPIRGDLAITGAFSPRGEVLEIGGVREKVSGSVEEGAKVILVPKANEGDLEDIPASVKSKAEIHIVETIDDVMKLAFVEPEPQTKKKPTFETRPSRVAARAKKTTARKPA